MLYEVITTASGQAVATFSLATTEKFKNKSGEQQERTEWHNIVAWGPLAEICGKYLTKGKQIYCRITSYNVCYTKLLRPPWRCWPASGRPGRIRMRNNFV